MSPIKRFQVSFIVCLVIGAAILLFAVLPNPVRTRFTQDDEGAAYVRIPLMKVAARMIIQNPWMGVGLNTYTEEDQAYDTTDERITMVFPQPVHNVYLQLGAEIGIPGLLCFLWFIGVVFYKGFDVLKRTEGLTFALILGMMGGQTAFLVHALVSNGSIASYHFLPFWFFSGIILGMHRKRISEYVVIDKPVDDEVT
jgi:O-antigen ligase